MKKVYTVKNPNRISLVEKISRKYTGVSQKFIRKSPGRQDGTQKPVSSGSYDMTGGESDDHKIEIGAPVLISKITRLDLDEIEPGRNRSSKFLEGENEAAPVSLSSDSDNDVYMDAAACLQSFGDIKFSFFPDPMAQQSDTSRSGTPITTINHSTMEIYDTVSHEAYESEDGPVSLPPSINTKSSSSFEKLSFNDFASLLTPNSSFLHKANETAPISGTPSSTKAPGTPNTSTLRKKRSKSAQNLHKSELKVFLHRFPSLETDADKLHADKDTVFPKPYPLGHNKKATSIQKSQSWGANDTAISTATISLKHSKYSAENLHKVGGKKPTSSSQTSLKSTTPVDDDFNMKSVSCQSLDAKNLFLSIDELNEITKQINESEDFNQEIDYEYCEHRSNLQPSERRITLLRKKNASIMDLGEKKEKISKTWSGLKHWFDEERDKIREVVHKHAAMQRVGVSGHKGGDDESDNVVQVNNNNNKINLQNNNRVLHNGVDESSESGRTIAQKSDNLNNETSKSSHLAMSETMTTSSSNKSNSLLGKSSAEGSEIVNGFKQSFLSSSKVSADKTNQVLQSQNGFEELRRYVKQGGDFGKELAAILQERIEAEQIYAKTLSKMATKLNKTCREIPGTVADAWRGVSAEMENRGEVHRQFANSLAEEIAKPLKAILDNQHKARKVIEGNVDKSSRILTEWRTAEAKAKKNSHSAARENEKLQDAMLDVRIQRSPSVALLSHVSTAVAIRGHQDKEIKVAEKDCAKLDNKRRKAEESVKRSDVEYYTLCIRAERARVDWEIGILRGASMLQSLENQRLSHLKTYAGNYLKLTTEMNPVYEKIVERLAPQVNKCDIQKDMCVLKTIRRSAEGPSEQLLPDFYSEHTTLAMNRERRKQSLVKLLQLIRQDLDRERRSRNGLKGLTQTLSSPDNQNIADKLYHIRSMLTYLEGARYKLHSALLELDHKQRGSHPLAQHIQITRDRTGLQQSVLKVPLWLKNDEEPDDSGQQLTDHNDNDADLEYLGDCVDIKNEVLIKHLGPMTNGHQFPKLKSNSLEHETKENGNAVNGKASTMLADSGSPIWDRGAADGVSNQPDSDFDEFSDEDDDHTATKKEINGLQSQPQVPAESAVPTPTVIGRCQALYSYTPKLYDELELEPGDIIEIHTKQDDGWWLGKLNNNIGIFPATYVEELQ